MIPLPQQAVCLKTTPGLGPFCQCPCSPSLHTLSPLPQNMPTLPPHLTLQCHLPHLWPFWKLLLGQKGLGHPTLISSLPTHLAFPLLQGHVG